jgi:hypothetical protein
MYMAMDAEELAEAVAFHETQAAYQQTWQDVASARPDGRALPSSVSAPVAHRIPWTEELPAVGQFAATTRSFLKEDVAMYARLSGDRNPLHLDPEAWVGRPFTGNLVHGALTETGFSPLQAAGLQP